MINAFINIFRISELRNKLLFTIAMLVIYRIGFWIPLPGVDQGAVLEFFAKQAQSGGVASRLGQFIAIFTGGALGQSTIFGLGVMPYISASIIFQLLGTVYKPLEKLQKEGPAGYQKIQEYTRYATVGLCAIQGFGWLTYLRGSGLIYADMAGSTGGILTFYIQGTLALIAGSVFLMWLGEQIDRFGLGNGVSLIITAGILSRIPNAIYQIASNFSFAQGSNAAFKPGTVIILMLMFFAVTAGAVLITVAQRRIPIQQAKQTRGRKMYGGMKSYLPLRVNHGGVMPIIFAQSLMIFPSIAFSALATYAERTDILWFASTSRFMADNFNFGSYLYIITEIILIYFFSYFWTTVQFNPKEMSEQLRDHGSFIPGLRPGPRTAEYLETVLERVTYVGAGFLALIAVVPTMVSSGMGIPYSVSSFLGGTGLLIVVSVGLDFVQRIEANLVMRNYEGFLSSGDKGKASRVRGRKR